MINFKLRVLNMVTIFFLTMGLVSAALSIISSFCFGVFLLFFSDNIFYPPIGFALAVGSFLTARIFYDFILHDVLMKPIQYEHNWKFEEER